MAEMVGNILDYIDMKELNQLVDDDLREYAREVCADVNRKTFDISWNFYRNYSPMYYRRKYSLIANEKGGLSYSTWPRSSIQKNSEGYQIEFTWDSSMMETLHSQEKGWGGESKGELIFDGPFIQGYHGGPVGFKSDNGKIYSPAPQMSPSPWESILEYMINTYNAYGEY